MLSNPAIAIRLNEMSVNIPTDQLVSAGTHATLHDGLPKRAFVDKDFRLSTPTRSDLALQVLVLRKRQNLKERSNNLAPSGTVF